MTPSVPTATCAAFPRDVEAHSKFKEKFLENNFDTACTICNRYWYERDSKPVTSNCMTFLSAEFPQINFQ